MAVSQNQCSILTWCRGINDRKKWDIEVIVVSEVTVEVETNSLHIQGLPYENVDGKVNMCLERD